MIIHSNKKYTNPCFRCGKERIISKTWVETIITSTGMKQIVEHTETECPDSDCQNLLNIEFAKQKEKRDKITFDKEQRMKENQLKRGGPRPKKDKK